MNPIPQKPFSLSLDHWIRFHEEVEALIRTNLPLNEGLRRMLDGLPESSALHRLASRIAEGLERGQTFTQALEESGVRLSPLYLAMIRSGEQSGSLAPALRVVARGARGRLEIRSTILTALIYPMVVCLFMLALVLVLVTLIFPRFEEIYSQLGAELPALTLWTLKLNHAVTQSPILLFPVLILILAGIFCAFLWVPRYRQLGRRILGSFPVIGPLLAASAAEHWMRCMAWLLRGGVAMDDSLVLVAESAPTRALREVTLETAAEVRRGGRLADPLSACPEFSPSCLWMLARGEERGDLVPTLEALADLLEMRISTLRQRALIFFEPALLIFLGVGIGTLVVAFYLPFFSFARIF